MLFNRKKLTHHDLHQLKLSIDSAILNTTPVHSVQELTNSNNENTIILGGKIYYN